MVLRHVSIGRYMYSYTSFFLLSVLKDVGVVGAKKSEAFSSCADHVPLEQGQPRRQCVAFALGGLVELHDSPFRP
jgi:hypothetical protein